MAEPDATNMPFIKNLASSIPKTRLAAVDSLRTFLSAPSRARRLGRLDHLRLWKGLFYAVWMCDRPRPQQALCADLASLLDALPVGTDNDNNDPAAVVRRWLAAFWETMAREWTGVDVLRMDKFLLLVRRVLGASLAWARQHLEEGGGGGAKEKRERGAIRNGDGAKGAAADDNEDAATSKSNRKASRKRKREAAANDHDIDTDNNTDSSGADAILDVLAAWPLEPTGDLSKVPVGLRLHVLDIWVDEAAGAGLLPPADDDDDVDDGAMTAAERAFGDRLRRLVEAQSRSTCRPVRLRARESLADHRLPGNVKEDDSEEDDDDDGEAAAAAGDASSNKEDGWGGFDD
ncbi:Nop52-domain-containing protein [Xylariaceae sp. FL0804]|nr:Nop52-domain-containing protein [Xylariaceae sp. FL0804]